MLGGFVGCSAILKCCPRDGIPRSRAPYPVPQFKGFKFKDMGLGLCRYLYFRV